LVAFRRAFVDGAARSSSFPAPRSSSRCAGAFPLYGAGPPLMGSGESQGKQAMKAELFRSTATWLAAMFVGTMFVAATTSFAHVL
jgi:hypothetical protein